MSGKRRLILHVGLPKTGTSALQTWCDQNREQLRKQGVDYPVTSDDTVMPKHQYLVGILQTGNLLRLQSELENSDFGTVLLSSEGLSNHLYDFRPAALERFRAMTATYDVFVFLISRNPASWRRSYYKQSVINPPAIPGFHYATSLSLDEFSKLPRVVRLSNVQALREDLKSAFGAKDVWVAHYEEDWMSALRSAVGIRQADDFKPLANTNVSISDDLIEIIRQVNALGLPDSERASVLSAMQACFATEHSGLKSEYGKRAFSPAAVARVLEQIEPRTEKQREALCEMQDLIQSGVAGRVGAQ